MILNKAFKILPKSWFSHFSSSLYNRTMHFWGSRNTIRASIVVDNYVKGLPELQSLVPKSCWTSCGSLTWLQEPPKKKGFCKVIFQNFWGGWFSVGLASQELHTSLVLVLQAFRIVEVEWMSMYQCTKGLSDCHVHNPYSLQLMGKKLHSLCSKYPITDASWHHEELSRIRKSKDQGGFKSGVPGAFAPASSWQN